MKKYVYRFQDEKDRKILESIICLRGERTLPDCFHYEALGIYCFGSSITFASWYKGSAIDSNEPHFKSYKYCKTLDEFIEGCFMEKR